MPRIKEDPQFKMTIFLDAAEKLFNFRGYQATKISDIAKSIEVSQGIIYYYFKSKEEVLEAIIRRKIAGIISEIEMVINTDDEKSFRKIELIFYKSLKSIQGRGELLFEYLYNDQHLYILDRIKRQVRELVKPILLKIVEEGIKQGYFKTIYPIESVDFLINIIEILIDSLYKKESTEKLTHRIEIAQNLIEKALDAQPGIMHITAINN
jgi:Transcriptional regulator